MMNRSTPPSCDMRSARANRPADCCRQSSLADNSKTRAASGPFSTRSSLEVGVTIQPFEMPLSIQTAWA